MREAALALCLLAQASAVHAGANVDWLLDYKNKSANDFIWDKRSKGLIEEGVPKPMVGGVLDSLSGPPDPVYVEDGRYVSLSACMAHFCEEKGFLWVDIKTGQIIAGLYDTKRLQLGSKTVPIDAIPKPALKAVRRWLKESSIPSGRAVFCDARGKRTKLDSGQITPANEFVPSLKGPSFDCATASSRIEKTVCADGELALMDLRLSDLYQEIRRGTSTEGARTQLRDLQRSWVTKRDAECADGQADCLKQHYQAQYMALRSWLPGR